MTGRFFAMEASHACPGVDGTKKGRCRCREKKIRWTLEGEAYPVVNGRAAGGFPPGPGFAFSLPFRR